MVTAEGLDASDPRAELDLARRAHRGDSAAFEQLVLRFHRPVYRLCWRMLRTLHAEDLARETFIRAFVHFDRFYLERPLLPWLLAIARRLCLDRLRRKRVMGRSGRHSRGRRSGAEPGASGCAERAGIAPRTGARRAGRGPEGGDRPLSREEMSYRDIVAALEVPMGTVMTWLHRGRAQLKRAAEDATVSLAAAERSSVKDTA